MLSRHANTQFDSVFIKARKSTHIETSIKIFVCIYEEIFSDVIFALVIRYKMMQHQITQ